MTAFAPGRYAIAICQRCGMKCDYRSLRLDGNIPNFYVCSDPDCYDQLDPYKLPPRPPDRFVLHHPRPDFPLGDVPNFLLNDDGSLIYDENGNPILAS